ncbi:MAG TPA: thioesterase family protein [Ferruginibacter sp.]|nr:thioesterase family protein [Ferruginibacter sp.]
MSRIRIEIPEQFMGTFHIPVRIADINYGNHVGNDAFVGIIHEARMQWLKQYDYTELSIGGIGLIMSGLAIEFKNESFYGDVVEVRISAGDLSAVGFDLFYLLSAKRNEETILLAKAKTGMVCYDYAAKKIVPVPAKLKSILKP